MVTPLPSVTSAPSPNTNKCFFLGGQRLGLLCICFDCYVVLQISTDCSFVIPFITEGSLVVRLTAVEDIVPVKGQGQGISILSCLVMYAKDQLIGFCVFVPRVSLGEGICE